MLDIHFFGHSFFKIAFPGRNILIDPYLTNKTDNPKFRREVKCAAKAKDLKDTAMILVTHEHFDHFDKALIESIAARDNACVVAHAELLKQLNIEKRVMHPISMNETICLRNVDITATPAHHPPSFYPLGFLIKHEGTSVFHSGDTSLIDNFSRIRPDVALLPIGGTYTMDCVDAVRAVKTMKPKYAIPMHYNTFSMIKQDPSEFKARIDKSLLKTEAVILSPGQKFSFAL